MLGDIPCRVDEKTAWTLVDEYTDNLTKKYSQIISQSNSSRTARGFMNTSHLPVQTVHPRGFRDAYFPDKHCKSTMG